MNTTQILYNKTFFYSNPIFYSYINYQILEESHPKVLSSPQWAFGSLREFIPRQWLSKMPMKSCIRKKAWFFCNQSIIITIKYFFFVKMNSNFWFGTCNKFLILFYDELKVGSLINPSKAWNFPSRKFFDLSSFSFFL